MIKAIKNAKGQIYLPVKDNTVPNYISIQGLSIYNENANTFNSSYTLTYENNNTTTVITYNSFVSFPYAFTLETEGITNLGFNTEIVIDNEYLSLIPPFLIKLNQEGLTYEQIQQIPNIGFIKLVYYNDDILFLMSVPYGVIIYSKNRKSFYKISLPGKNLGQDIETSVTMIGSTIYLSAISVQENGNLEVILMKTEFTYSDTVFSIIYQNQIQIPQLGTPAYYISVVGNIEYIVSVVGYSIGPSPQLPGNSIGEIIYYVYNIRSNTVNKISTGKQNYLQICTGTKPASIYGSYVYNLAYNINTNQLIIFSLNLKTSIIENTEINVPNEYEAFLQGNNLMILNTGEINNPIKQGNIYFLPINYEQYKLINSDSLIVQYTEISLDHNVLHISGIVKYLENGNPCIGCMVYIYNVTSVIGNQIGIKESPLAITTTDNKGNFNIEIEFKNNPQNLNIAVIIGL